MMLSDAGIDEIEAGIPAMGDDEVEFLGKLARSNIKSRIIAYAGHMRDVSGLRPEALVFLIRPYHSKCQTVILKYREKAGNGQLIILESLQISSIKILTGFM